MIIHPTFLRNEVLMKGNVYYENELKRLGYKGKFTSITHTKELKSEIQDLKRSGKLNADIFDYYLDFDFEKLEDYRSIAIIAMELPVSIVEVEKDDSIKEVMIPSAYYSGGKVEAFNHKMKEFFNSQNIKYKPIHLPCKLLVARTGLGAYGRNNIAYIDDFGSYFRMKAFLTDIHIEEDNWKDVSQTELCSSCNICIENCPNHLISKKTYLIDAGRCITFFNEIEGEFPDWIDPKWHNAIIGCMKCQYDCPHNLKFKSRMKVISRFNSCHVEDIFNSNSFDHLSEDTKKKVIDIECKDHFDVFKRNFKSVYQNI